MSRGPCACLATGLLVLALSGCASTPHPTGAEFDPHAIQAPDGMAAIVIYRESAFAGSKIIWRVTEGVHPVATITAGAYYPLYVKPGTIDLYAIPYVASSGGVAFDAIGAALLLVGNVVRVAGNKDAEGRKAISVNAKANSVYYLKWESVAFSKYPRVTQVSSAIAQREMDGLQLPQ